MRIYADILPGLFDAYQLSREGAGEERQVNQDQKRVAAVCWRAAEGGPHFLLVRTRDGKRWTFPKGRVEPGEKLQEAAAREALEEAGVVGKLDTRPVTSFDYPGASGRHSVSAFLLEVLEQREPQETFRGPRWFSVREAPMKLAGGREGWAGDELARVVDTAAEHVPDPHSRG